MTGPGITLAFRSEDRAEVLAKLIELGQTPERAENMLATADEYEYGTVPSEGLAVTKPAGSGFYTVETSKRGGGSHDRSA
jgi:hypothetical protein